jgi:hypothetical protein
MEIMRYLIATGLALSVFCGVSAVQDPWDFVPGEKLLVYDDYSDMPKGGALPHWKVRGATLRLVEGRLVAAPGQTTTMWPNVVKWPNNFTIEMDILGKPVDDGQRLFPWEFFKGDAWVWNTTIHLNNDGGCRVTIEIADPGESQAAACPTGRSAWPCGRMVPKDSRSSCTEFPGARQARHPQRPVRTGVFMSW